VAEHDRLRAQGGSGLIQGGIPSCSRGGFWATHVTDSYMRNLNRVEAKFSQNICGAGGNLAGDRLNSVLDNHRPRADSGTWRLEGNRCRERQTIRATRTSNQHQVAGNDAGGIQAFAHGTANIGDGRCQAWAVSQGGLFSVIFI
jgi:hypothetical protein